MDPTIPPNYMQYALSREDASGDPNAQNPRSSAGGPYQFTTPTWNDVMQRHPELNLTSDGRFDPIQANKAMQAFTTDNANTLSSSGVPVNNNTLYLAHRFGAQGALSALKADPTASASSVFPDDVMKANPDLRNKRVGDLTGATAMADNTTPAPMQPQPQQQQPTLFGGNPTPVGLLGGLSRMLGIGSEDGLGRRLQNAGASLMSVGNFGQDGARGAAMMQEAANQPHFNVVTDALGNRIMFDTRSGAPVSMNGNPVGAQQGQPAAGQPSAAASRSTALNQSPVALAAQAKSDADLSSKKMEALDDAASQAQNLIDLNNMAMTYSKNPNTVQGPGLWNLIREHAAKMTGGSVGNVDLPSQESLEKLNSQLVSGMLSAQKGIRFAAPEIKFGQTASADTEKPAATNQQIYSDNIQNARRAIAVRDIARAHYGAGYSLNGPEFSKAVQDYQTSNPVYQPDVVKPASAAPDKRPPLDSIFK